MVRTSPLTAFDSQITVGKAACGAMYSVWGEVRRAHHGRGWCGAPLMMAALFVVDGDIKMRPRTIN